MSAIALASLNDTEHMPLVKLQNQLEDLAARLEVVTLELLSDGFAKRKALMAERRLLLAQSSRLWKLQQQMHDLDSGARAALELVSQKADIPS